MPTANIASKKSCPLYDYSESNMIKFTDKLSSTLRKLPIVYDEDGYEKFCDIINSTVEECFKTDPKLKSSKRNKLVNPWIITQGIITSVKDKNFLYKKWKKSTSKKDKVGDHSVYMKYKEYRETLKGTILDAKKLYHSKKFQAAKGDMKKHGI